MAEEKNMSYISIEGLLKKVDSLYKLVILASRRATELNDGKQKLVDVNPRAKITTIALQEIIEGKIGYKKVASPERSKS